MSFSFILLVVPSGPPRDVSALVLSQTAILIRWDLPELLERNGPVVGYVIVLTFTNGTNNVYSSPHGDVFNLQIEGMFDTTIFTG